MRRRRGSNTLNRSCTLKGLMALKVESASIIILLKVDGKLLNHSLLWCLLINDSDTAVVDPEFSRGLNHRHKASTVAFHMPSFTCLAVGGHDTYGPQRSVVVKSRTWCWTRNERRMQFWNEWLTLRSGSNLKKNLLLAIIALSAVQSSAQTLIHNVILFIDTSNNA